MGKSTAREGATGATAAAAPTSPPQLIDAFLAELKAERNFSEHTIRAYSLDLAAFVAWLEPRGI
ncbi:MAG: site-specific integrase, partial [Coriobacteriales bacterium]|nr:site-specific integrase [Coriobacteriales bacterium]